WFPPSIPCCARRLRAPTPSTRSSRPRAAANRSRHRMADRRRTIVFVICAVAVVLAGAGTFLLFSREHNALARQEDALKQDREQAEEAVKIAEASVSRARAQKSYQILRAPFDGTVTGRFADPGTLLPAATGSTSSAQPLVEIADLSRLRVALNLAQDDAA